MGSGENRSSRVWQYHFGSEIKFLHEKQDEWENEKLNEKKKTALCFSSSFLMLVFIDGKTKTKKETDEKEASVNYTIGSFLTQQSLYI